MRRRSRGIARLGHTPFLSRTGRRILPLPNNTFPATSSKPIPSGNCFVCSGWTSSSIRTRSSPCWSASIVRLTGVMSVPETRATLLTGLALPQDLPRPVICGTEGRKHRVFSGASHPSYFRMSTMRSRPKYSHRPIRMHHRKVNTGSSGAFSWRHLGLCLPAFGQDRRIDLRSRPCHNGPMAASRVHVRAAGGRNRPGRFPLGFRLDPGPAQRG